MQLLHRRNKAFQELQEAKFGNHANEEEIDTLEERYERIKKGLRTESGGTEENNGTEKSEKLYIG